MTGPDATTTNVAGDSAYVGVQAGTVHDLHYYTIAPDASPQEKFEKGVRYLDGGMPGRARQLISEAAMSEYIDNRVRFYRLLALVSGRAPHELSEEETSILFDPRNTTSIAEDEWADGVRAIHRLLKAARDPEADLRIPLQAFDVLGKTQRTQILRHMAVFLDGPIKDQMWDRALGRAEREQMAGDRINRVWKFFEPSPAGARQRPVQPAVVPLTTRIQAIAATIVSAAAMLHIGYLLAHAERFSALLACLPAIAGGYLAARGGAEWRFRTVRLRVKDAEYGTSQGRRANAPPGGFASKVDKECRNYFARYVPRGAEPSAWLAQTAGFRRSIRDEIVELYREQRTSVEQVAWLIRHRVGKVGTRWANGTLWNYRTELATPLRTKAMTILGIVVLGGGVIDAVGDAVRVSPLSATRSTVLGLAAGWLAIRAWLRIALERRRHTADEAEAKRIWEEDKEAFARWLAKLADKPDDREMAAWLDCDRKMLLSEALRHYQLAMSKVIAFAFIEAPATGSTRRARLRNGPWRYMAYRFLLFLLTSDGVRQLTVSLDFEYGTFHDRQRINYRYEAVAAVQVTQSDTNERTFELGLVDGQKLSVQVMESGAEDLLQDESPGAVCEVTLDAAGLHHTLHVLEGIAAEGKEWITCEYRRAETRTNNFAAAMHGEKP